MAATKKQPVAPNEKAAQKFSKGKKGMPPPFVKGGGRAKGNMPPDTDGDGKKPTPSKKK